MNTKDITSQCQVVHFAWDYEGDSTGDLENISVNQLGQSTPHDVSRYITSASYSKKLSDAAGSFEIVLANTKDWKDVIKKGSWLLMYMSQDGGLSIPKGSSTVKLKSGGSGDAIDISKLKLQKSKVRVMGYIDTVRARGITGEKGELDVEYVITGRDYGVVYEDTEIWHNEALFDFNLLTSAASFLEAQPFRTVDSLLDLLHKLFFSPADIPGVDIKKTGGLTSLALQWMLPSKMLKAMDIQLSGGKKPYYGNIPKLLNFSKTKASFPVENPLALLNGVAWDRLKAHSIDPYHELFTEMNDEGHPQLTFRMLPWKLFGTNRKFPTINPTIQKFGTTGIVDIPTIDISDFDVGEDNHTRFNAYITTVVTNYVTATDSRAQLQDNDPKTGFPRLLQNGIRRHGLRLFQREINAMIDLGQERVDSTLLRELNEFSIELWARSHEYESGTISIIGNNGIRVGKCLKIAEDAPYNANKIFYIEGYEDSYSVNDKGAGSWEQTIFVTRGIEDAVLKKATNINNRVNPTKSDGEFTEN
tara:strand:+ start:28665 stop:30257 length:1593 start_codon:yes stop_codon:yes gene_type:complete